MTEQSEQLQQRRTVMKHAEIDEYSDLARVAVIGVGGGGGSALNHMIREAFHKNVHFIAVDVDNQALEKSVAPQNILLGAGLANGCGARANPEVGRQAAHEGCERIKAAIGKVDMVIVVAGMGGGTGTGAVPVIAQITQELGALTVPVVTLPFFFEGKKRMQAAQEGIAELLALHLSPIVIPCDAMLLSLRKGKTTCDFSMLTRADQGLCTAVQGITEPILREGYIGYDFADHKVLLSVPGIGAVGVGKAAGSRDAAMQAISGPLLGGRSIGSAQGVLVHITGGPDCSGEEIGEAVSIIQEAVHEDARIVLTFCVDESLKGEMHIIVTFTGIPASAEKETIAPQSPLTNKSPHGEFEYPVFTPHRPGE
jgi:cell division protein FtsZ